MRWVRYSQASSINAKALRIYTYPSIPGIQHFLFQQSILILKNIMALHSSPVNLNTSAITPAKVKIVSPRTKCWARITTSHLLKHESSNSLLPRSAHSSKVSVTHNCQDGCTDRQQTLSLLLVPCRIRQKQTPLRQILHQTIQYTRTRKQFQLNKIRIHYITDAK